MAQSWRTTDDTISQPTTRYYNNMTSSEPSSVTRLVSASMGPRPDAYTSEPYSTQGTRDSPNVYKSEMVLNKGIMGLPMNQPNIAQCQKCKRSINLSNRTEISFNNSLYHPDCFRCAMCDQNLPQQLTEKFLLNNAGEPICNRCESKTGSTCVTCRKPIGPGTSIDYRGGSYHPDCFRCGQCNTVMTEKEFFTRDSKPCCNKCYKERFAQRCAECYSPITDGKSTIYNDKPYHPDCFRCGQCRKTITEKEFFTRDSKPCCNKCYNERFAQRCAECSTMISDGVSIKYDNKSYHPNCFRCGQCKEVMTEKQFFTRDSKPCCSKCYNQRFADRCTQCCTMITDGKSIIHDNKPYHPNCLRCSQCHQIIGNDKTCYTHESKLCCSKCYNDRFAPQCAECLKPIPGKIQTLQKKSYHPECLRCGQCRKQLTESMNVYERDSKPCCSDCIRKSASSDRFSTSPADRSSASPADRSSASPADRSSASSSDRLSNRLDERCAECYRSITDGRTTIYKNKVYHPDCLRCISCKKKIDQDMTIYEHNYKPCCSDCYSSKFAPQCAECLKPIDTGVITTYKTKKYHPDCFRCGLCNKPMTEKEFFTRDGKPCCNRCYNERPSDRSLERPLERPLERAPERFSDRMSERPSDRSLERPLERAPERSLERAPERFSDRMSERPSDRSLERTPERPTDRSSSRLDERCAECFRPITDGKSTIYKDKVYHPDCFRCGQCNKPMTEKEFYTHDSKPCCTKCHNERFAERCTECSRIIADGRSTIFNKKPYHPDCFRCGQCNKPMTEKEFFTHESKPCCSKCYNERIAKRCTECNRIIADGKSTIYENKPYHPECFRCGQCKQVMTEKEFFVRDGKPCCSRCHRERPSERFSERSIDRPSDRLADRPYDRSLDRPSDRLADRPYDRSLDRPADRPYDRSSDRPYDRSSERSFDRLSASPSERSSERPSDPPYDRLSERPYNRSSERTSDRLDERCAECYRTITDGRSTIYKNKVYHPDCLRCVSCNKKVGEEKTLHEHNNKPCCTDCFTNKLSPQCAECLKPIVTGVVSTYKTKKYHPDCFRCGQCNKPMTEQQFFTHDSKPCCSKCYNERFAEHCTACHGLILDGKSITYNNKAYHLNCIRCGQCRRSMADEKTCHTHNGEPCCNECFNNRIAPRCVKCTLPVTGKVVTFQQKSFHPECFVCSKCQRIISSTEKFFDDPNGYLCQRCAN